MRLRAQNTIWVLEFIRVFAEYAHILTSKYKFDAINVTSAIDNYGYPFEPLLLEVDESYLYKEAPQGLVDICNPVLMFLYLKILNDDLYLRVILEKVSENAYKIVCYLQLGDYTVLGTTFNPKYIILLRSDELFITDEELQHLETILPQSTEQFNKYETGLITYMDKLFDAMSDLDVNSLYKNYKEPVVVSGEKEQRRFMRAFFDRIVENPHSILKFDPVILGNILQASEDCAPSVQGKPSHVYDSIFVIVGLYWASGILTTLADGIQGAYVEPLANTQVNKFANPIISKILSAHVYAGNKAMKGTITATLFEKLKEMFSYIEFVFRHIATNTILEKIGFLKDSDYKPTIFSINTRGCYGMSNIETHAHALKEILHLFFKEIPHYNRKLINTFLKDMVSVLIEAYNDPQTPDSHKKQIQATLDVIYSIDTEDIRTKQVFVSIMSLFSVYKLYYQQRKVDKETLYKRFINTYEKIMTDFSVINPGFFVRDSIEEYFNSPVYHYCQYDKVFGYSQNKRLKPKVLSALSYENTIINATSDVYKEMKKMIQKIINTI